MIKIILPEVSLKQLFGNMQQFYRRVPVLKCQFNNAVLQVCWNQTLVSHEIKAQESLLRFDSQESLLG